MFQYEKELQASIMEDGELGIEDFYITDLRAEYPVGSNRIDILGIDWDKKSFCIFELKLGDINHSALAQILDYIADFRELINHTIFKDFKIHGFLVGKSCSVAGPLKLLQPSISFLEYKTSLSLEICEYVSTNELSLRLKEQSVALLDKFNFSMDPNNQAEA